MKRFTAILIALVIFAVGLAACGNTNNEEATPTYEGELSELITALYEKQSVNLPVVTIGTEVDLSDADITKAYLGLDSAEGVKEAFYSETMMGSQAYSLVVARADYAKVEEIKNAMFNGIDTRKWICVEANEMRVTACDDIIMLIMIDTQLGEGVCDSMVTAFESLVGERNGEILAKG